MSELYDSIAAHRKELGLKPECDYCQNTGYRTDYIGSQKPCTKCFTVDSTKPSLIDGELMPDKKD